MKQLRIMDWYVHQSHQREFFKTGHRFLLSGLDGQPAKWDARHLPLSDNVSLVEEARVNRMEVDVVIIRSPLNVKRYEPFLKRGAKGVAVVQTTGTYPIPDSVKYVVWNSYTVMNKYSGAYKNKTHLWIPHGFSPEEYRPIPDIVKNNRILTMMNVFKKRGYLVGYPLWEKVNKESGGVCDVWGHDNEDIGLNIRRTESFDELIRTYNSYGAYFNPTNSSAMPRARGEAAMCGCPIISTNNFDASKFFTNKKNAILTNNPAEILKGISDLRASEQMRVDFGWAAREVAMKNFHINDYIKKWNDVFLRL